MPFVGRVLDLHVYIDDKIQYTRRDLSDSISYNKL